MSSSMPIRIIYDETFTKVIASVYLIDNEERTIFINKHWVETKVPILDSVDSQYYSSNKNNSFDLSYVPKKERTLEVCLQAFTAGKELSYVPENLRSKELCLKFVKRDKQNLRFVPDKFRDEIESHPYD
jgi:hypothetical protein